MACQHIIAVLTKVFGLEHVGKLAGRTDHSEFAQQLRLCSFLNRPLSIIRSVAQVLQ